MQAGILSRTVGILTGNATRGHFGQLPGPGARFMRSSGEQLAYDEYGSRDGYPLFYFHDAGSSRLECAFFHRAARKHHYRLIAIDRPGVGCSDYYSLPSAAKFCEDVLALADNLGIAQFGVLSLGSGGVYALTLAHMCPQRVSLQLSLAGVPGNVFNESPVSSFTASCLNELTPTVIKLMAHLRHSLFFANPEQAIERMLDYVSAPDRKTLANPRVIQTLALDQREATRQGSRGIAQDLALCFRKFDFRLNEVRTPIVIWQGCSDRLSSRADCEYLVARIPGATFYRVPNRGHFFFVHCMDEILGRLRVTAENHSSLAA